MQEIYFTLKILHTTTSEIAVDVITLELNSYHFRYSWEENTLFDVNQLMCDVNTSAHPIQLKRLKRWQMFYISFGQDRDLTLRETHSLFSHENNKRYIEYCSELYIALLHACTVRVCLSLYRLGKGESSNKRVPTHSRLLISCAFTEAGNGYMHCTLNLR